MTTVRLAVPDDALAIARVHVDSWRSTYAGIVPQDFLDGLSYERRAEVWRRSLTNPESQSVMVVAEDETGRIIGFAVGGPERIGGALLKEVAYGWQDLRQMIEAPGRRA